MDRVDQKATGYLEHWNTVQATEAPRTRAEWLVRTVMRDLEEWIEGRDPNGASEAGCASWSQSELLSLYAILAPSASFFSYPCRSDLLPDTS